MKREAGYLHGLNVGVLNQTDIKDNIETLFFYLAIFIFGK